MMDNWEGMTIWNPTVLEIAALRHRKGMREEFVTAGAGTRMRHSRDINAVALWQNASIDRLP